MSRDPRSPRCAANACVDVTPRGKGFVVTNTNTRGNVQFTPDEVVTFLDEVKAGKWDHILNQARAML